MTAMRLGIRTGPCQLGRDVVGRGLGTGLGYAGPETGLAHDCELGTRDLFMVDPQALQPTYFINHTLRRFSRQFPSHTLCRLSRHAIDYNRQRVHRAYVQTHC